MTAQLRRSAAEPAVARDGLTGLPSYAQLLTDVAAICDGGGARLLVVLDADGFAAYNAVHGHAAADHVLRRRASVLSAAVEAAGGVAYRAGGDRFALLLPPAGAAAGLAAARGALAARGGDGLHWHEARVAVPAEAADAATAWRLVERRLRG